MKCVQGCKCQAMKTDMKNLANAGHAMHKICCCSVYAPCFEFLCLQYKLCCEFNANNFSKKKKNSKSVYAIFMDHKTLLYLTDLVFARYLDGERLTAEDEKAVVEKLLAYHPHSEDKIGCGLDSIMVSFFVHSFS